MTSQDYQERLRTFYDRERIAVGSGFECPYVEHCRRDADPRPLTFGAEAHVGQRYGRSPRLLIVSLDARGDSESLIDRQASIEGLQADHLNAHMRGTRLTIETLLGPDLGGASPWPFFAMTNAAKCSGGDGRGDKVPDLLYQRCREFAVEELRLLDPEVIVAQGGQAHAVVAPLTKVPDLDLTAAIETLRLPDGSPVGNWVKAATEKYVGLTRVTGCNVIALTTPHPSDRGGRWHVFVRLALPITSWLIRQLLTINRQRREQQARV